MSGAIPIAVIETLMRGLVPHQLALIRKNRAEHPEFVPWDDTHDASVAAFTAAAFVAGLQKHLVLDDAGAADGKKDGAPVDTGGMFR